jgi:ABC-type dipeptide/oligopeptide/nickel transport system permease subunit
MPTMSTLAMPSEVIRSPWRMAARRFFANVLAVVGLIAVALMLIACFATLPWTLGSVSTAPPSTADAARSAVRRYEFQRLDRIKQPPTRDAWMGTDALGRDLAVRFLLGGAISLSLGIASALIAIFIGTAVGLWAGYAGGRTDAILMRLVDILYGLPYILLVILMRVALVPLVENFLTHPDAQGQPQWLDGKPAGMWANFAVLLVGIGAVSWLTLARVIRGQVLSLRSQPFVEAARALGLPWFRIMTRHILPNLAGTIIVYGTLTVPAAILSESFLSFLGLGIAMPLPSWGNLASDGLEALNPVQIDWWLIAWPCLGLSLTLLALNFLGDGLRDALDTRSP